MASFWNAIFIADNQLLSDSWNVRRFQVMWFLLYLPNLIYSVLNSPWSEMRAMSLAKEVELAMLMCLKNISRVWMTCSCWSKGARASVTLTYPLPFLPTSLAELCCDVCKRDTAPERRHSCKIRHQTKPKSKYPLVWREFRAGFASDLCCHFQMYAHFHDKLLLPVSPTRNVYIWLHARGIYQN